jgi:uncharacterized MAPEG superfamily protein
MGGPALELKLLGLAVVVGLIQVIWAAAAARKETGIAWGMGPRDEPRPLTGVAGRLDRALKNFLETFPLFAAALITAYLMARLGALTVWGAGLYVAGRALYAPLYAAGVPAVRSLVWAVSMVGIILVVVAIFL